MKILFWRNTSKADKRNLSPIYVRITIKGTRSQFSTGIKVSEKEWNSDKKRLRGSSNKAMLANSKLTAIEDKLNLIHLNREERKLPITSRSIKDVYFHPTHSITVLHVFNEIVEERQNDYDSSLQQLEIVRESKPSEEKKMEKIVERKKRNLQKWKHYQKHFQNFLEKKNRKSLLLEELNIDIANQYFRYLRTEAMLANNTAVRNARPLKTVIRKAIEKDLILANKLDLWKLSDERKLKSKYVWLTDRELSKLENYRFTSQALQKIADLYIFQCYTGFRYSDLRTFDFETDTFPYQGEIYISKTEFKTDENALLPLFPKALEILKKYKMQLPKPTGKSKIISNAKYNKRLKEIAEILGIKKYLTTHTARITAGMKWLNSGVPIEIVARMLGDSVKTVKRHYAYILPDSIHKATEHLR